MQPNLKIKELFFNQPTKHWHFGQLLKEAGLSRAQTNQWLKKLLKENHIKRIKPKGKMPFYVANYEHPHYQNSKRLYALQQLYQSGFLDYAASLEKAKTIVLFGSFSRSDWYKESDIDLFVYGDIDYLNLGPYLSKLHREVQLFAGKTEKDLQRMGPALLRNILKGITLKGTIPLEVIKNAAV